MNYEAGLQESDIFSNRDYRYFMVLSKISFVFCIVFVVIAIACVFDFTYMRNSNIFFLQYGDIVFSLLGVICLHTSKVFRVNYFLRSILTEKKLTNANQNLIQNGESISIKLKSQLKYFKILRYIFLLLIVCYILFEKKTEDEFFAVLLIASVSIFFSTFFMVELKSRIKVYHLLNHKFTQVV